MEVCSHAPLQEASSHPEASNHASEGLAGDSEASDSKVTKSAADYRPREVEIKSCHDCIFRIDHGEQESTCRKVRGTVDRKHVCDFFHADETESFFDQAFVGGFALHADQFLPRSRTAREHAVRLGERHKGLPDILGFIDERGQQEGLYAKIFMRRDRLWHTYDLASRTWSKQLSLHLDHDALVALAIQAHGTVKNGDKGDQHSAIKAALVPFLTKALTDDSKAHDKALTTAANSQVDAKSEGTAAAAALLAHQSQHTTSMDSDVEASSKKLKTYPDYWRNGQTVLDDQISGLAGDLAPTLSAHIDAGDSSRQMTNSSQKILGIGAGAAFYIDQHIQATLVLAMLAYYHAQRVVSLNYVTQGDNRVCPVCIDNEDGSPYTLADVPMPPVHGGCRCVLSPV